MLTYNERAYLVLQGFERGVVTELELADYIEKACEIKLKAACQYEDKTEPETSVSTGKFPFSPWLGYDQAVHIQNCNQEEYATKDCSEKRYTATEWNRCQELRRQKLEIRSNLRDINKELEALGQYE